MRPTTGLMHVENAGRVVISEADLWRPIEDRSFALETENRRGLDSRRAIAYLLDRLLLLAPSTAAIAAFGEGGVLVATALTLVYFFVWEALTGQTAGKRLLGLRVVRRDGAPLNLAAVATRNVLLLIDQFVGVFFIVATRRRQRLGDLVAGTVVTAADDHAHVAAAERYRTAILLAYPVAWVGAALIAGSAAAGQADRDRYLGLANFTCANARAALTANPNAGLAEMHRTATDVERSLRGLQPPGDMRASHARLVAAIHRQRALLGQATRARGRALAQVAEQYRALAARDAVAARSDGYPGCA
jgi:uncharacterized RDD family membrane protein YckC